MHTFVEFVHVLRLAHSLAFLEGLHDIDSDAYDKLFVGELYQLAMRVPKARSTLESLKTFHFTSYIARSVRNSGIRDAREIDERTHEVAAKLLLGGLFNNYNPEVHGPFMARFSTALANLIRNQIAKDRTRRRYLPRAPIRADDVPARSTAADEDTIDEFRRLVGSRLGPLGVAVLDLRLAGTVDVKSLIGSSEYGSPSAYRIKQIVIEIKRLIREVARKRGDEDFLRQVERAMAAEEETMKKRFALKPHQDTSASTL